MSRFAKLNGLENLQVRVYKAEGKAKGKRKVGDAVDDPIADQLAKANSPAETAEVASQYGIPDDLITERAKKAPQFGQFRMTIGNMIRGCIARQKVASEKLGRKVSFEEVGTPKLFQSLMAEFRKANKPAKPAKASGDKKDGKSKGKSGLVARGASDGAWDKVKPGRGGAPSKAEAAGRGRGKKEGGKRGGKRGRKSAGGSRSEDGVEQSGGDAEGTVEAVADEVAAANA